MRRWTIYLTVALAALVVLTSAGCAYYNTFYNVRKRFAAAERDTRQQQLQQTQQAQQAPGTPPASQRPVTASPDKYRKVIEGCSKLLEYYPKSRWVDDALLLMGISYFRLGELVRAERKFTELITIFPKSKLVPDATLWKARLMAEQRNRAGALQLLEESISRVKTAPQKAELYRLLGDLCFEAKRWPEAAAHYQALSELNLTDIERIAALHRFALARFEQGRYEEARDAFAQVARRSRDLPQTYDAYVHWSRCEAAMKQFAQAEAVLAEVESHPLLSTLTSDVSLERAQLAVAMGHVADADSLYRSYLAGGVTGEKRGLALYRLALLNRDYLANLPAAKAYLDSAVAGGADKATTDSAKAALDQNSKGLLALQKIRDLLDQIALLESPPDSATQTMPISPDTTGVLPDSLRGTAPVLPSGTDSTSMPSDSTQEADSARAGETGPRESPVPQTQSPDSLAAPSDSLGTPRLAEGASPAALRADSILRALMTQRTSTPDSLEPPVHAAADSDQTTSETPTPQPVPVSPPSRSQLLSLKTDLQRLYLQAAEFYQYSLADSDSALHYYRLAAADTSDVDVLWRANLFVAGALTSEDGSLSPEATERFRAVLNVSGVPVDVANVARAALGLPLVEEPVPEQDLALRVAEIARASGEASTDSVLALYSTVIRMDSTTAAAQCALFAKGHIYEKELRQYDSARVSYEALLALHPDCTYVRQLKRVLAEPDSESVFLLTDAQLFDVRQPAESILESKPDSTGWPPPEESLRGRRFR